MKRIVSTTFSLAIVSFGTLFLGCGQKPTVPSTVEAEKTNPSSVHAGWWCTEHGIPEDECAQCSSQVASDFQKKGDWCKEHNRPESQCFICHPELEGKFAARYEAKFGEKPPKRTE